jgi:hypothetical protein
MLLDEEKNSVEKASKMPSLIVQEKEIHWYGENGECRDGLPNGGCRSNCDERKKNGHITG